MGYNNMMPNQMGLPGGMGMMGGMQGQTVPFNMGPMGMGAGLANGMGQQQPAPKRDYSNIFTLYVGNLSDKTFDLDLLKFFNSKGYKIASVRVMFDQESKRSKGFGYLNFYS
jgi:RNA recognition motif-containing protein